MNKGQIKPAYNSKHCAEHKKSNAIDNFRD